jgi:hypothetical protein
MYPELVMRQFLQRPEEAPDAEQKTESCTYMEVGDDWTGSWLIIYPTAGPGGGILLVAWTPLID